MKLVKFIVALLLTAGLTFLFDQSLSVGGTSIPPFGKFLNPFTGFWQNATPAQGKTAETIDLDGLSAPAKVLYDERMVPHIFAANLRDAYFLQGYVTAKERLWQMDITIRSTVGRLAEVMGERLLDRDRLQRRKGFGFGAANTLKAWSKDPEVLGLVEQYAAGINAYILSLKPSQYPVEFK
ncbi:MAG: penicillin acylase family protein, partial [Bacteroidota bacterium]